MSTLSQTLTFAYGLYRQRAGTAYAGYVRGDPVARLALRPGRLDPYACYERLRAQGPLTPTRLGNWASTSHRICDSVLRDRRFCVGQPDGAPSDPAEFNMSFLDMNPPDHTRLRRLATPAFSPKAVATYTGRIERVVGGLLDRAAADGEFDLVSAFAGPLPIAVITDLLGVPDSASADFSEYGAVIGSALDGIESLRQAAALKAADAGLRRLFDDLFELRRREPGDDIVSRLVATEGDQIKPAELLPMCILLLVAGFETTTNLLGNGLQIVLRDPRAGDGVRDGSVSPAAFVEEVLRFDSPVQLTSRIGDGTSVNGVPVSPGTGVVTLLGAGNRDPRRFTDPARFDPMRPDGGPLSFGGGAHFCIGAALARLEGAVAFPRLLGRFPKISAAAEPTRRDTLVLRGFDVLPVTVA